MFAEENVLVRLPGGVHSKASLHSFLQIHGFRGQILISTLKGFITDTHGGGRGVVLKQLNYPISMQPILFRFGDRIVVTFLFFILITFYIKKKSYLFAFSFEP